MIARWHFERLGFFRIHVLGYRETVRIRERIALAIAPFSASDIAADDDFAYVSARCFHFFAPAIPDTRPLIEPHTITRAVSSLKS